MESIVSSLGLVSPDIFERFERTYRGYSQDSLLTGKHFIAGGSTLSVSNIADNYCDTNVSLYLEKGINRLEYRNNSWKKKNKYSTDLGVFIQDYIFSIIDETVPSIDSYREIIETGDNFHARFMDERAKPIANMKKEEIKTPNNKERTSKVVQGIQYCSRYELLFKSINQMFGSEATISKDPQTVLHPNKGLGLSTKVTPDFIIKLGDNVIVGDIKTGDNFKKFHKYTCTGYALAYESEFNVDVNYGMIYFIPTLNYGISSKRHFIFPQIFFFEIDETMRYEFIQERNRKYEIISQSKPPSFPKDKGHCENSCAYIENCKKLTGFLEA